MMESTAKLNSGSGVSAQGDGAADRFAEPRSAPAKESRQETAGEHIRNALQVLAGARYQSRLDEKYAVIPSWELAQEDRDAINKRLRLALEQIAASEVRHLQVLRGALGAMEERDAKAREAESLANWMADVAEALGLDRNGEWHFSDVVKAAAYAKGRAVAGEELAASLRPMGAR